MSILTPPGAVAVPASALVVARVLPAYQQVADQLRALVLDGVLSAGDRLPRETELAAQFGVSRSTVREALRVLASQRLVHTERGSAGGSFVAHFEPDGVSDLLEASLGLLSGSDGVDVQQMLEARDVLEVPAARLAASRRDDTHVEALHDAIAREVAGRERRARFSDHRTFHQIVLEASGNTLLAMMNEPLFRVLQAKFLRPTVPDGFWAQVDHDHEALALAIADRDPRSAGALMADHLLALREAYTW